MRVFRDAPENLLDSLSVAFPLGTRTSHTCWYSNPLLHLFFRHINGILETAKHHHSASKGPSLHSVMLRTMGNVVRQRSQWLNPDDTLHLWRSEFLDEKQCVLWAYNNGQEASRCPWMEVSSENLQAGKANSCSDQVIIPGKSNHCPFHDGSGPVKSTCHQGAGSPLGNDVLRWGSWAHSNGGGGVAGQLQCREAWVAGPRQSRVAGDTGWLMPSDRPSCPSDDRESPP